jgi:O-antigen ligase
MRVGIGAPQFDRWFVLPAYLLFFLLLVFPMVIDLLYVKAILFAVVLFIIALRAIRQGRLTVHPTIALWTLALSAASLVFLFKGSLTGAPGVLKQAQVYVFWPIVYMLLIAGASNPRVILGLQTVMVLATFCAGAYGLNYILTQLGILPAYLHIPILNQGEAIGFPGGYLKINVYFLNSLPFLVPFVMAALTTNAVAAQPGGRLSRLWWWTALALGLGLALASGRRALMLTTVAAPFVILGFILVKKDSGKARQTKPLFLLVFLVLLLLTSVIVFLSNTLHIDFARAIPYFQRAVDSPRREQFQALTHAWAQHPFLGAGLGASTTGSVRSETMPWAYELYYVALLFQTGLVGVAAYAAGVSWIYIMGVKVIRAGGVLGGIMLPVLVGTSCFLIANAVDPYLARFDGLWVIFLPIAVINCWLLAQARQSGGRVRQGPAAGSALPSTL